MILAFSTRQFKSLNRITRCNTLLLKRQFGGTATWKAIQDAKNSTLSRTRNVGIIAHIDAGKTTTTERMLYYSGHTKRIGNVDEGSTVTDFLPAERARGITIQSAAITFNWSPGSWLPESSPSETYDVNLIDTPGHADFTFEVLRSLRVLDGAVCILDAVAGVEAQTEKVWHQSRAYGIPTIFYVNKMDRVGAKFGESVRQIASKLNVMPAVCQIPWYQDGKEHFHGVVDVIELKGLKWMPGSDGKTLEVVSLADLEAETPDLALEAKRARTNLIELLSEEDEIMIEKFLEFDEDHLALPAEEILASLRRCLLSSEARISPVFAGASFKNIGVQPVLDAIARLLPNPDETVDPPFKAGDLTGGLRKLVAGELNLSTTTSQKYSKGLSRARPSNAVNLSNLEACALAFKVVNDPKRGILVYVRVYHGTLHRNSMLYNTNLQTAERMPRLLRMYASDSVDEESIGEGEIAVIPGLKHARTGDTLITYKGVTAKNGPPSPLNAIQLRPIDVPPPVFFTAVEPSSAAEQANVNAALALLLREDPSLQIGENDDTGQQLLNGMGELHLEIASNRLIQDFKAKATVGKIEIAYRECPSAQATAEDVVYERTIAGMQGKAGCTATVSALTSEEMQKLGVGESNLIIVQGKLTDDLDESSPEIIRSLRHGALSTLARGPNFGYPVYGTKVELSYDPAVNSFGPLTTPSAIGGAARKATRTALEMSSKLSPAYLLEPVMRVMINVDDATLGAVKRDIESRTGVIESLDQSVSFTATGGAESSDDMVQHIDLHKVYAPPDPFEVSSVHLSSLSDLEQQAKQRKRIIIARVPLKEMIGYLKHLRSLTAGRGSFLMDIDGFKRMNKQRENIVLKELRGDL